MHILGWQETTVSELAQAADANLVTHTSWVQQQVSGMQVHADARLVVVDSGLDCDTLNVICRARLTTQSTAARVESALACFRNASLPFSWWVGPADTPAKLGEFLLDAGLEEAETEEAMALDLDALCAVASPPPELRIERVRTPEQLADFAAILAANWNPPDTEVLHFYRVAESALLTGESPLWLYVGYLEGLPVASSELTLGGGVAGLYNVCTLEAYRRRGIGGALTLHPLYDAKTLGCRVAVLQASAEGARVYRRLGFLGIGRYTEYKPSW